MLRGNRTDGSASRRRTSSRCAHQLLFCRDESLVSRSDARARDGILIVSIEGIGACIRGKGRRVYHDFRFDFNSTIESDLNSKSEVEARSLVAGRPLWILAGMGASLAGLNRSLLSYGDDIPEMLSE